MPALSSNAPSSYTPLLAEETELRRKLIWLTVFRTVATSLLLAAIAGRLLSQPPGTELSREDSLTFGFVAAVYVLTLIYGLVLRMGRVGKVAAYVQVLGDVVLATCLVYVTGGSESPYTFTYSIAVVAASILLFQQGALIAAATSSIVFGTLVISIYNGWLRAPMGLAPPPIERAVFALISNVLAQFLIAALASYLSRQLWAAGGRLSAREADLKELVRLQRQILAAMPSGLITCEADGNLQFVNRAAATILGVRGNEENVRHVEQLIPGLLKVGPHNRRNELSTETPAGRRILGLTITHLEGKEGALLIVFQDLTELRRMETELRRVDHLAALGTIAAQLAHEIRNPLASMRGSAQMLAQEHGKEGSSARLANILIRESDRLSGLVEDFLKFARPPPPSLKLCSLTDLVRDTVEMIRADPMTSGVKVSVSAGPLSAKIDPDQMKQVLLNLLRNAFAAAKAGGEVRVDLDEKDGHARVRVWDSAGSIPSADLTRIFEPFFTTREGGTGLGLSTAHSIVRAHGGMIQVTSSPATGTEFVVGLPSVREGSGAHSGG